MKYGAHTHPVVHCNATILITSGNGASLPQFLKTPRLLYHLGQLLVLLTVGFAIRVLEKITTMFCDHFAVFVRAMSGR